jgi:hypothetical protein
MIKVNSISGGKTSAYVAAHYPADYDVFSLVRTSDPNCRYPDEMLRQQVEDRLQCEFIGTLEDDEIIHTMLDLEQHIGRKITWVTGITYDDVIWNKGGWLPNVMHRYCTTHLKLEPIFKWWAGEIGKPVEMRLGYRANEATRMNRMIDKLNADGLLEMKATFGKNDRGQNKWEQVAWQKPLFPLITDKPTYKEQIENYWKDKPVRFAAMNNCVGCFHRNPILLRKMFDAHPNKMEWFARQEEEKHKAGYKGNWRNEMTYRDISKHRPQIEIDFSEFDEGCESGYCGL